MGDCDCGDREASGFRRQRWHREGRAPSALATSTGPGQDRFGLGASNRSTPLCSHQRSLVLTAGAEGLSLTFQSQHSQDIYCLPQALESTLTRGERGGLLRASSVPTPGKARSRTWAQVLSLCFQEAHSKSAGDEEMAEHPWRSSVPQPLLPNFFQRRTAQRASSLSRAWEDGGHFALFAFVLESDQADSPVPRPPSPRTPSILFKPSKV